MSKHVFCRTLTLDRGEPHAGMGSAAERFLMLAWPKGKWRVPRYESVDMGPALGEAVRLAMQSKLTRNTMALVEGAAGQTLPTLFAYPEGRFVSTTTEAETVELIERWTAGEPLPGEPDGRITILCCTDAKRDACCARFGFATYKSLVAAADPARFNVLQCTHLGGCRFAASLVVLPLRQRYARLTPEEIPAFLAAVAAGEVYLPASRGNPRLDEPAQAAELAAQRWGAERGHPQSGISLGERLEIDGTHLWFAASIGNREVTVRVENREFEVDSACHDVGSKPPKLTRRWVTLDVVENPPTA